MNKLVSYKPKPIDLIYIIIMMGLFGTLIFGIVEYLTGYEMNIIQFIINLILIIIIVTYIYIKKTRKEHGKANDQKREYD